MKIGSINNTANFTAYKNEFTKKTIELASTYTNNNDSMSACRMFERIISDSPMTVEVNPNDNKILITTPDNKLSTSMPLYGGVIVLRDMANIAYRATALGAYSKCYTILKPAVSYEESKALNQNFEIKRN
ncbi:MAG: hypothetical protein LBK53_05245 [Heliobacteriaceae bacterium]|jgi:hypothetical protein|nr:hypothetical protein [Heliobacteriaceae bacterium]